MVVSWETVDLCTSVVEYGKTPVLDQHVENLIEVRRHSLRLENLDASTKYYYRVATTTPGKNSSALLEISTFMTAPTIFAPFTFAVTGDTQTASMLGRGFTDRVVNRIMQNEMDAGLAFMLQTGDQFSYGSNDFHDIQRYFTSMRPLARRVSLMTAVGNHDRMGGLGEYTDLFHYPQTSPTGELDYFFTYAGCYFLVLNVSSYRGTPGIPPDRLAWIEARLQDALSYKRTFVAFHVPYYASQFADYPTYLATLMPLIRDYNVTGVFTGHLHYYEHMLVDGVHYFINGGGGGDLNGVLVPKPYTTSTAMSRQHHYLRVAVTADNVVVTTISETNQTIDSVIIS